MKKTLLYLLIACCSLSSYSQGSQELKFIFVPHPRSENKVQQSVLPAIEKIDFSLYNMKLLGGDLTYYTSINRKSLDYCDSLFNLSSPNTLWTFGNHDPDNRSLIREYTGKESFYTYYRDKITFLVLDTELDANGFTSAYIKGEQLDMIKNVSDTITSSDFLIVLHHRLLWMIGNHDFDSRIDSVGESTRQLDTTNFYQEIYPLLQNVKSKGIKVICLGGDKSKINIEYSPEDSITFFASTMAPEFTDSRNDVLIFSYNIVEQKMEHEFVALDKVEKLQTGGINLREVKSEKPSIRIWQDAGSNEIRITSDANINENALVRIYNVSGVLIRSFHLNPGEIQTLDLSNSELFLILGVYSNSISRVKIIPGI
jgi:predicted phosphodiesterase